MTLRQVPTGAVGDLEAQALFEEARRRRRRRWRVFGAGFLLAAAATPLVILIATLGGHSPDQRTPPASTPVSSGSGGVQPGLIVIDNDGALALINFSTGTQTTATLPHRQGGDYPYALVEAGGSFVYPGDGGTWAIGLGLSGPPRFLGPSAYLVPSATAGRVWLVSRPPAGPAVQLTAQEVTTNGRYRGPLYRIPDGFGVIAGVAGGLLLDDTAGPTYGTVIWNLPSTRFGTRFPGPNRGNLVDVHGSTVAWAQGCLPDSICSSIRVTDLTTGHTHDYPAPRGTTGWVATGGEGSRDAFSSDGQYMAVRATKGASQGSPSDVYVIRMSTGTESVVPDSGSYPYSRVAWLPHSSWVVSQSAAGSTQAFNVQGGKRRSFPTPCCGVALLTVAGASH